LSYGRGGENHMPMPIKKPDVLEIEASFVRVVWANGASFLRVCAPCISGF